MKTQIFKSYEEFQNRKDKSVNGVSELFAKLNPDYEKDNLTNIGSWNCYKCNNCYNCRECNDCKTCVNCYSCSNCNGCNNCDYCRNCKYCNQCFNCNGCSNYH